MMFYKETNFKETAIGKIPKDWEVTKLEDIAHIYSGNTAPQDKKYFEQGNYPFIRVQHLQDLEEGKYPQIFDLINDLAISELKLRKFKKGSIIFPKSGESIRLEKRAILREDSYLVNHLAVIEPIDTNIIDNLFLFYYLLTIKTSNYLTKTTMPSLNLSIIQKFLILLPPLIEQQKIAEILSTVDEAIQKTNEIIAKTERLKKGLMQELLTKGIGHKEFKDTEIGRIPKDWEVINLENGSLIIRTGPFGSQLRKSELSERGAKVYTQENILKNNFSLGNLYISYDKFEKLKIMEVKPGDVLLTIRGSTGYSAVFPERAERGIIHTNLAYIRLKRSLLLPEYLSLLINGYSPVRFQIKTLSSATTLGALYAKHIKKIKIPLPPLQEQQKIVKILLNNIKKLELERNEKVKLERIKQGLMDLLLTGKIRVKVT